MIATCEGGDEDVTEDESISNGDHNVLSKNWDRKMSAFDNESKFDTFLLDKFHPNAKGCELWLICLNNGLSAFISDHGGQPFKTRGRNYTNDHLQQQPHGVCGEKNMLETFQSSRWSMR